MSDPAEMAELVRREPYAAYDMGEHGETRVGPAQEPDLLAMLPGQRLLDAGLIQGRLTEPGVGGVRLRFDRGDLIVMSLGDEWVLRMGSIPPDLATYLTFESWLGDQAIG